MIKPVVIKFGGELLEQPAQVAALTAALARFAKRTPTVIVHGGGREIDAALARVGIAKRQVDGLRITDEPTLEIVVSVLAGLVNTRLVAALNAAGAEAVGLTGADAGIGQVSRAKPHRAANGELVDLGYVGEPVGQDEPALLRDLCRKGYVPVVSSIGASREGRLFNVNADTLAASLAGRLKARRLVIAGATPGVYDAAGATIADLDFDAIDSMIAEGTATAGMVAKLTACRTAVVAGAQDVFIADGTDVPGLMAIAKRGRTGGAATATRISRAVHSKRSARRKAS